MIDFRALRLRFAFLALAGLAAGNLACKSVGGLPPLQGVRSADEARAGLLASVTVAPLDRITGDVDSLSRTLGLPFTGKDLLSMLTAQHKLDAGATAQIDTSKPIGVAFVAPAAKGQPPLEALVLSARDPAAGEKLIAALGTPGEKQQAARKVTRPDGSVIWVATAGASIFAAGSVEGLVAAAALALEAQRPPTNDVVVSVFPDAFARWQGTDVKTAVAGLRRALIDEQIAMAQKRGGPVPGRAERLMYETTLDLFVDPLAQTASGTVTLDLDPAKGIRFGLRMKPRSGSGFAKQIAKPTPCVVDPALLAAGSGPAALVWALGPSAFWLDVYDKVLMAQGKAGFKGAADLAKQYQAVRPYFTGAGSGVVRVAKGSMSHDVVLPLAGSGPAAVLGALTDMAASRSFHAWLGEIYGSGAPVVRAVREPKTLRSELTFPVRDRPGDVGTTLKAVFGSATLATLMTVSGNRLLVASEPAAAGRLVALGAVSASAPEPDVASALGETRGQDAFVYVDVWSFVRPALGLVGADPQAAQAMGMLSALPGLAQLKLPMVLSYRGGDALGAELRVPLSTLTNAANVVRPFIGGQ